jgi:aminomethyltransferase
MLEAGTQHGMAFGSLNAMGIRRIEAGILDNLTDFDISMTPFQAGLGRFIELDKADFIGRAALLKADRETLLYGVKCLSGAPRDHSEILDGTASVGRVTTGAWSPFLECGIGYVRFNEPGDWAGKSLLMKTQHGEFVACEILALPFYDPEKRIPRGLENSTAEL